MMRPNYKPLLFCTLLPGLWLLSACVPALTKNTLPAQKVLITRPLIKNSPSKPLVKLYQYPSPASPLEQNQLRLQAIEALIKVGDNTAAKQAADTLHAGELLPEQRTQLKLLYAQILLSAGEAEQAIESLLKIQPEQLNPDQQINYFQAQAFAYSLNGNLLDSTQSRIKLHPLINSPTELEKNQTAILEALSLLSDDALQPTSTEALAGWQTLANTLKKINQPDFNIHLTAWKATFPAHPADLSFLDKPQKLTEKTRVESKKIALFLPESGPFVLAGKAIRAGFMAASNLVDNQLKLTVHFYDSEQSTPQALYQQAVAEGAQLIIGPLAKEQIQSLADAVTFNIPVLALNHIPGLKKNQLYQFSLSPLDDADQITHKARTDNHQNMLMLIPENSAGNRIRSYLADDWQNQGGTILETQTYKPKAADFSSPIQKLLNLDESEQRYHKILVLIPAAKYTPRRRQDADAILLSAYSAEARSINPQLQFYQAGDLPVYALPSVYSGQINTALDADLNKTTFCDIPWLFNKTYQGELSMEALKQTWKPFTSAYLRLIAMGIDAYKLATRLDTLEAEPYSGATGILSLTIDQRIQRKLICAKFIAGQPEITEEYQKFNQAQTPQNNHAVY